MRMRFLLKPQRLWWGGLLLGLAQCRGSDRTVLDRTAAPEIPSGSELGNSTATGAPPAREATMTGAGSSDAPRTSAGSGSSTFGGSGGAMGSSPESLLSDAGTDASAAIPPAPALFPADWCSRLGGVDAALDIAAAYDAAARGDCATAGLISQDAAEYCDWLNYLEDYTLLMAGCVPDYGPPPGGILAFGPGNTPGVGAVRAPLSTREAALLTHDYVQAFAGPLSLSPAEQDAVRAYLLHVASSEIDPNAKGALSLCAPPDAGP